MSAPLDCERMRELAPELALGIADGEQRAAALIHLAACSDCRDYLERLSTTADELLLLAPAEEPPLGFEERVLAEIQRTAPAKPTPARRRLLPRPALAFATVAIAAIAGAAAVWVGTGSDRDLAADYRATLDAADGSYFAAAQLRTGDGREVGDVFGYEGHPSWVMVVVEPPDSYPGAGGGELPAGAYRAVLVTDDGRRIALGRFEIEAGTGSLGGALPVAHEQLSRLSLLGPGGDEVASAGLDDGD